MKYLYCVIGLLVFLLNTSYSETYISGKFYFDYTPGSPDSAALTNCSYTTGTVTVPSSFTVSSVTYNVRTIGNGRTSAFSSSATLNIVLPSSVTTLSSYSLSYCQQSSFNLTPLTSLRYIYHHAFYSCPNLLSISIPSGVSTIFNNTFDNCVKLSTVTIPNSVTTIGDYAFSSTAITNITLQNTVTTLGQGVFSNCTKLISCILPAGISAIPAYIFYSCPLSSYTIPTSVVSIGNGAFMGCPLGLIQIPDGVTSIGDFAFLGCTKLTSVSLPSSLTTIGRESFSNCKSLGYINIPSGVTSIGNSAFSFCPNLSSLCFMGPPPQADFPFDNTQAEKDAGAAFPTIYFLPTSEGWNSSFAGRPTSVFKYPACAISVDTNSTAYLYFNTMIGLKYVIQGSTDLLQWTSLQSDIQGDGTLKTYAYSTQSIDQRFFRVVLQY